MQEDSLTIAFITGRADAVLVRVDSLNSDYLMLKLVTTVQYSSG